MGRRLEGGTEREERRVNKKEESTNEEWESRSKAKMKRKEGIENMKCF